MGSALRLSRILYAVCFACVLLCGDRPLAASAPAPGTLERAALGDASSSGETLVPTAHPAVPHDLSLLWLAPVGENRAAASTALGRFASGVTLYQQGKYDDALNEIRYAQHIWGDAPVLRATVGWLHHQKGELLTGANVVKRSYPQYIAADGDTLPSELLAVIFPMGYWSLIQQHAASHQLDPYLLAALIAQESAFIPDIRSPAKAAGLMQLMPATAQRYARNLTLPYSPAMVRRPETNIRLGTTYFADLLREFGDVHLALASYNAGESRVRRWVAERPDLPPDEFVDDIPFPETQNYVKKILGAAENYRRVYRADSDVPSNPNRAIPSLASRKSGLVQTPPRPSAPRAAPDPIRAKAKPASAPPKAKPGRTGSKAQTAKPKSTESPLARTSTRRLAKR